MSGREYSFTLYRDSSIPEGRELTLGRMRAILAHFPNGVPDRANCFFYGLIKGWVLSDVIGPADADEIDELLPPRPAGVIEAIPYRPDDVRAPEVRSLTEEQIPDDWSFQVWIGITNDIYFFRRDGKTTPERSVLAWLGYLRGEFEGNGLSQAEYDKLRAMLPPVDDDLTPLVAATGAIP